MVFSVALVHPGSGERHAPAQAMVRNARLCVLRIFYSFLTVLLQQFLAWVDLGLCLVGGSTDLAFCVFAGHSAVCFRLQTRYKFRLTSHIPISFPLLPVYQELPWSVSR